MDPVDELRASLIQMKSQAPTGFAAAFHVDFVTPRYLFQTYDEAWMNYYSSAGLVLKDPAVRWGFDNDGIAAWPDLVALDSEGIFDRAAEHGLNHWAVVATSRRGSKSIGAFSRAETSFSPDEKREVLTTLERLHDLTHRGLEIDPEFDRMLTALSVNLTHRDAVD